MSDPERTVETLDDLREYLDYVRQQFDPEVDRIAQLLQLSEEDVAKLAVILLGQQIDITNDPETFVIVVRGSARPYDTALEALLNSGPGDELFAPLLQRLQTEHDPESDNE